MRLTSFRNIRRLIILCSFSLFLLHEYDVPAQTGLSIENLGQIRVDQMTDAQIQSFMRQIQASGMSQQELELLARSRGMSATELNKLRRRMFEMSSSGAGFGTESSGGRMRDEFFEPRMSGFAFEDLLPDSLRQEQGLQTFGIDIFDNVQLSFEPSLNLPTPVDYKVGPGDEIIVDIWGASERTYQLQISPEGYIHIPNLGPVFVNGLAIEDASSRITRRLTKIYSGLVERGREGPNTYAQVTLGNLRSIKIHVVGEVKYPGTFTLSSLATVFNALYYAGGPTESGSLRQINLMRGGKQVATLDVYEYLLKGNQSENLRLQDQDVVMIPPYLKKVVLDGEVKRPSIYESRDGESVGDVLAYAGGFSENAYTNFLSIKRNTGTGRTIVTVNQSNYDNFTLKGGDQIYVQPISDLYANRVQILGAVHRPGDFELTDGLTLTQLIEKADGLKGDAFLGRGVIVRMEEDYSLSSHEFNVSQILNGENADIILENEDVVHIKSIYDLREEYVVTIEGEVKNPGDFKFVKDITVEDLILLANGLKESASKSSIEVARRIKSESAELSTTAEVYNFAISPDLSLSESASTFKLEPFDLVIIRRSPTYEEQLLIQIEGEVLYPGKYSLAKKNERISDVLKRAGGLSPYAYLDGATLIRRTEFYTNQGEKIESQTVQTSKSQQADAEASDNGSSNGDIAIISDDPDEIRRQRMKELGRRALNSEAEFKTHEFIGIDLNKIMNNPGSKLDLILREGDILSIPRQLQTVRLRGELLYPITTRHDPSFNFKDYISQAGGFSLDARKGKSYVVYANGSAERTKGFLFFKDYPKIEPGAEIFVPTRRERRRLSAGEILGIATSFVSLALLIDNFVDRAQRP